MIRSSVIQGHFPHGLPRLSAPPVHLQPPAPIASRPVSTHAAPAHPGFPAGPPVRPGAAGATLQRLANGSALQLPAGLSHLDGMGGPASGPGQRLPHVVQQKMEAFFKTSFADVRVHVGPQASAIGALAFTCGSQLFFAPGQYDPSSERGQQLLGHELTHVVQQRAGRVRNPFGSGLAVIQDHALEAEAERLGRQAARQELPAQAQRSSPGVPRIGLAGTTEGAAQCAGLNSLDYATPNKRATNRQKAEAERRTGKTGSYTGHKSRKPKPSNRQHPTTDITNTQFAGHLRDVISEEKAEVKSKQQRRRAEGRKKNVTCSSRFHHQLRQKGDTICGVCNENI